MGDPPVAAVRRVGHPCRQPGRRPARRGRPGLIGFLVSSLALRVDLSGSPTAAEALDRTRALVSEAPLERVVDRAATAPTDSPDGAAPSGASVVRVPAEGFVDAVAKAL
ncbi:hypothetical protein [Streptomyces sp. NPDC001222]|uniref:hypothetical protein n=1 Tax=Streptomyces sp. NPDC001222 TaxID=3364548 RepID=UPI00368E96CE